MIAPTLPVDEAERLAELQALEILDTPSEARFDRIVELAAGIFHAPIAYVAMIDADRQWFKSRCGLKALQTSRDVSFCAHTILHDGPLVVPDALLDPRFRDNPLVVGEPHIRFYAGHPLSGPGGHHVGTLCIADHVPRTLDEGELAVLARLAAMAEHELGMVDLIRSQRELLETKSRLIAARQRLANELAEAAAYVQSLLPAPLTGSVRTDWQYVSSSELGGDFFSYRWLDDHRLLIYLLDVMGHGVGAALLSTSIESALRGGTLAGLAFNDPAAVLSALNRDFPMDENGGRFFSIWLGVYDTRDRSLVYANAGHPPALLFHRGDVSRLGGTGTMVGALRDSEFLNKRIIVAPRSRLYLYSDGAYEIPNGDGDDLGIDGLSEIITRVAATDGPHTAAILKLIRETQGKTEFHDDVSLLEVTFD